MSEVKLKPCPFCGSIIAPRVMDQNEAMWIGPDPDYDGDLEIVVCCASRKGGCGASTGLCDTSERAVEVWNTRYTENPSEINENAPKFERKQFRRVILPFEGKTAYRRFMAILERVRK